jgi:phospholipid transport system substrate-binding protein
VLETIKKDASLRNGDSSKINALVNEKVMPYVDFRRMTSAAVGPAWRQATPEQRQKLQDRVQGPGFAPMREPCPRSAIRPLPSSLCAWPPATPTCWCVPRSTAVATPMQLDFRLEKQDTGWKLYNFNVLGVWLVETYRNQFAQEINANGIDGLIKTLASRSSMPATAPSKQSASDVMAAQLATLCNCPELTYRRGRDCLLRLRPLVTGHADARWWPMPAPSRSSTRRRWPCCWPAGALPRRWARAHAVRSAQGAAVHGRAVWRGRLADARSCARCGRHRSAGLG